MNALKQHLTVSLEPHVSMVMEVLIVLVQLVSLEMAERVDLVVQVPNAITTLIMHVRVYMCHHENAFQGCWHSVLIIQSRH